MVPVADDFLHTFQTHGAVSSIHDDDPAIGFRASASTKTLPRK